MSATFINTKHLLARIGTPAELPKDRKHCCTLLTWAFNRNWREAEEAGDYERMGYLARQHEQMQSL